MGIQGVVFHLFGTLVESLSVRALQHQLAAMGEALDVLAERKISELPVVDADGRPLGLLDITDVVGLLPRDMSAADSAATLPADGTEQRAVVPLVG